MLKGVQIALPEIADYEVRRELLRVDKTRGIQRLDNLKAIARYLPLTTDVMLRAAVFWAQARRQGKPTADSTALDGDVILAAQAVDLQEQGNNVVIATTNTRHLSMFAPAKYWTDIAVV